MPDSLKNITLRIGISLCLALPLIYIIQDKLKKYDGKIEVLKNFSTAERVLDLDHDGFTEELTLGNIDKNLFYGEVWNSKALLGIINEPANLVKHTLKIKDIDKDSLMDYTYVSYYHDTLFLNSSSLELHKNKLTTHKKCHVVICPLVVEEAKPESFKSDLVDVDGDGFDDYVFLLSHDFSHRCLYYYNFKRKKLFKSGNEFMLVTDFHKLTIHSKNVILYTTYANGNIPEKKLRYAAAKFGMDSLHSEKYFSDHNAYIGYLNETLNHVGKPRFKRGFTGMIRAVPVMDKHKLFYYTCETYINEPDSQQIVKILDENLNTLQLARMNLPYKNNLYHKYNRMVFQKISIDSVDRIILCGRNDSVYELDNTLKLNFLMTDPNIKEGSKVKQMDLDGDGANETIFFSPEGLTVFSHGLEDKLFIESPGAINSWVSFDAPGAKETKKGFYLKTEDRKLVFLSYSLNPLYKFRALFMLLSVLIIYLLIVFIIRSQTKKLEKEKLNLESIIKERTKEISSQNIELALRNNMIEEKQKEILDSIHYAKRIQSALLANKDLIKKHIPGHFILFEPKDIVSGDFYWAAEHNGKFYLAVCDSTGHGVPGAFMSLLNMGFLSEAIKEKGIEKPNEIFNYVRMRLINSISGEGQKDGMDGILICYDKENRRLEYASANNSPVLVRHGEVKELEKDRMPVGKGEREQEFKWHTISIEPGDFLYLYTDGYADQFGGPKGKKFKYKQLNQLLLDIGEKPMHEQFMVLKAKLDEWKGGLEQVDDILLLGIRI
jgi:serine phosphatase RsbU (regulator of sigma subunit)